MKLRFHIAMAVGIGVVAANTAAFAGTSVEPRVDIQVINSEAASAAPEVIKMNGVDHFAETHLCAAKVFTAIKGNMASEMYEVEKQALLKSSQLPAKITIEIHRKIDVQDPRGVGTTDETYTLRYILGEGAARRVFDHEIKCKVFQAQAVLDTTQGIKVLPSEALADYKKAREQDARQTQLIGIDFRGNIGSAESE